MLWREGRESLSDLKLGSWLAGDGVPVQQFGELSCQIFFLKKKLSYESKHGCFHSTWIIIYVSQTSRFTTKFGVIMIYIARSNR